MQQRLPPPLVAAVGAERDVSECKSRLLSPVSQVGWNSSRIRTECSSGGGNGPDRAWSFENTPWSRESIWNYRAIFTATFFSTSRSRLLKIAYPRAMSSRYGVYTFPLTAQIITDIFLQYVFHYKNFNRCKSIPWRVDLSFQFGTRVRKRSERFVASRFLLYFLLLYILIPREKARRRKSMVHNKYYLQIFYFFFQLFLKNP